MPLATKECCKCRDVQPVSSFYRNRESRDGLQSRCKRCNSQLKGGSHYYTAAQKRAHTVVNRLIAEGRRPAACERTSAQCEGPIEGHHEDYSRPDDVLWLCKHHHKEADIARRQRVRVAA